MRELIYDSKGLDPQTLKASLKRGSRKEARILLERVSRAAISTKVVPNDWYSVALIPGEAPQKGMDMTTDRWRETGRAIIKTVAKHWPDYFDGLNDPNSTMYVTDKEIAGFIDDPLAAFINFLLREAKL